MKVTITLIVGADVAIYRKSQPGASLYDRPGDQVTYDQATMSIANPHSVRKDALHVGSLVSHFGMIRTVETTGYLSAHQRRTVYVDREQGSC